MPHETRQPARAGSDTTDRDAATRYRPGAPHAVGEPSAAGTVHTAAPADRHVAGAPETLGELRPGRRLDRRAVYWWTTQNALVAVPVLAALGVASFVPGAPSWLRIVFAVLCPLGLGYTLLTPWYRYRVHRWEAGGEAVCSLSGWLVREWRVVPFTRIQTLDTRRGPLMQLFGLAALTVTTASAAGPVTISGLDRDLAVETVRRLTERVRALHEDGT
ncbi:PH domain-containing protein [Streptomyces longispororuber]|uniref:PH domain-containing protein n=1 Tax=Streptomyces longispororuber TaxID=68230 RepID=UPI0036FF3E56